MLLHYWEDIIDARYCQDCGVVIAAGKYCPACLENRKKINEMLREDEQFKRRIRKCAEGRICLFLGRSRSGKRIGYIQSKRDIEEIEEMNRLLEDL